LVVPPGGATATRCKKLSSGSLRSAGCAYTVASGAAAATVGTGLPSAPALSCTGGGAAAAAAATAEGTGGGRCAGGGTWARCGDGTGGGGSEAMPPGTVAAGTGAVTVMPIPFISASTDAHRSSIVPAMGCVFFGAAGMPTYKVRYAHIRASVTGAHAVAGRRCVRGETHRRRRLGGSDARGWPQRMWPQPRRHHVARQAGWDGTRRCVLSTWPPTPQGTRTPSTSQPAHLVDHTDGPARLLRQHGADQHHLGY
jgi:hypothetical protein